MQFLYTIYIVTPVIRTEAKVITLWIEILFWQEQRKAVLNFLFYLQDIVYCEYTPQGKQWNRKCTQTSYVVYGMQPKCNIMKNRKN